MRCRAFRVSKSTSTDGLLLEFRYLQNEAPGLTDSGALFLGVTAPLFLERESFS
jgi:hypothetical protein